MGKLFNMDNGIFAVLGKMADLMILNVVFLITCIPIITIGPAVTGLYTVTLKMVKNEESYIIRSYLAAFKANLKKSIVLGLIVGVMILILISDFWIVLTHTGISWSLLSIALIAIAFFTILLISYVFPVQAKFENSIINILKNSFLIALAHLPISAAVVVLNCVFPLCFMMGTYQTLFYALLIYSVIGFGLVAYLNSMMLVGVFEKYYPKEEDGVALQEEMV